MDGPMRNLNSLVRPKRDPNLCKNESNIDGKIASHLLLIFGTHREETL